MYRMLIKCCLSGETPKAIVACDFDSYCDLFVFSI